MIKLGIIVAVLVVCFGLFSMLSFLSAVAFSVGGFAITWKLIALGVVGYVVHKRVK